MDIYYRWTLDDSNNARYKNFSKLAWSLKWLVKKYSSGSELFHWTGNGYGGIFSIELLVIYFWRCLWPLCCISLTRKYLLKIIFVFHNLYISLSFCLIIPLLSSALCYRCSWGFIFLRRGSSLVYAS